jgi:molecular chaperone DnaK
VVNVSAKDLGTGRSQAIRVTASSGLSEKEVERLIAEAEQHQTDDHDRRALVDLRNKADGLIYSTERTLKEFSDNVDAADREALTKAVETARTAARGEDVDALRAAVDELSALTYNMTEKLYAELGGSKGEGR